MKPGLCALIAVGSLLVVAAFGAMVLNIVVSHGRVYRVAEARTMLTSGPRLWVRRPLLVRGQLDGCAPAPAPCPVWQPRLFDPDQPTVRTAIPVEWSADAR